MALNCIVVSGTGRIPERIQNYLSDARFFNVVAVVKDLAGFLDSSRGSEVHYLLMDQKNASDNFSELLKMKDRQILIFGPEELYLVENVKEGLGSLLINQGDLEIDTELSTSRPVEIGMEPKIIREIRSGTPENSPVNILVKASRARFAEFQIDRSPNSIFVRSDARISRIKLDDLLYVEAQKDYMVFHTAETSYRTLSSMKRIEQTLDSTLFFRLHRSFIVRLDKIHTIQGDEVLLDGIEIAVPIGPSFKNKLIKRLELL